MLSVLVCYTLCLRSIGNVLDEQGKPEEALVMHQKSLEIKLKVLGPEHLSVAATYNNIGEVYRCQAKYSEALKMYNKDLEISVKLLGREHPHVASTMVL